MPLAIIAIEYVVSILKTVLSVRILKSYNRRVLSKCKGRSIEWVGKTLMPFREIDDSRVDEEPAAV
jgi:hypothetical protein